MIVDPLLMIYLILMQQVRVLNLQHIMVLIVLVNIWLQKRKCKRKPFLFFKFRFAHCLINFVFLFFYWASCVAGYDGSEKTYICSSEGIWTAENGAIACTRNVSCYYIFFFWQNKWTISDYPPNFYNLLLCTIYDCVDHWANTLNSHHILIM